MKPDEPTREQFHGITVTLIGLAAVAAFHTLAYFSEGKLESSLLVTIAVITCTWLGGRRSGLIIAIVAAIGRFAVDALQHSISTFTAFNWLNAPVLALLGCALAWAIQSVRDRLLSAQIEAARHKRNFENQTAERQRTELELRTSEQRFRQLNENIKEVFWITDVQKTEMVYISPGYESIWGRTCQSLYQNPRSWLEAIHPEDREKVIAAAMKQQSGGYDEQYRIIRPDGTCRWIRDRGFPVYDDEGAVYRIAGVADDITTQKEAEQALSKSELQLRLVWENSLDGMRLMDEDGTFIAVNEAYCALVGKKRDELLGKSLAVIFPEDQREFALNRHRERFRSRGIPAHSEEEFTLWNEKKVDLEISSSFLQSNDGSVRLLSIFRDVSERKKVEKQLIEVSDREQARIGHDLHDELCQFLVGILFHCHDLSDALDASGNAEAARARHIAQLVDAAISQARQLARGLFPVLLEQEGLVPALHELASGVKGRFKTDCTVECETGVAVRKKNVANHLYRIAQEAVNNAARHGHARRIRIWLGTSDCTFNLAVTDDGTGFEYAEGARGMGLHIMNYRAHSIGGALEINSPPDSGTSIVCRVPLDQL